MSPDDLPFHQLRLSPNSPRQVPDSTHRPHPGPTAPSQTQTTCQCGRPQLGTQIKLPIKPTDVTKSPKIPDTAKKPIAAPEPMRPSLKRPAEKANIHVARKLTFSPSPEDLQLHRLRISTTEVDVPPPKRLHLDSPAIQQVKEHLQPIVNAHHGHRSRTDPRQADLMGPEDFEKASLAKVEAMLVSADTRKLMIRSIYACDPDM
jgi:hypothetical protein